MKKVLAVACLALAVAVVTEVGSDNLRRFCEVLKALIHKGTPATRPTNASEPKAGDLAPRSENANTSIASSLTSILPRVAPKSSGKDSSRTARIPERQADAHLPAQMVGRWYGEFTDHEARFRQRWVNVRRPDGTFEIKFLLYGNGGLEVAMEFGNWKVQDGLYIADTYERGEDLNYRVSNEPMYHEEYAIISLTDDKFIYRNTRSGRTYTVVRVDDEFVFP